MENSNNKILFTGCGRSGTKYISVLMRAMGLDIRHEAMGQDGISSWYMAVDSKEVPIGPTASEYDFEHVIQVVRHPLLAIKSITAFTDEAWAFICQHTPCNEQDPILFRSAKYWYYWNQLAAQKAVCQVKIEDQQQIITTIEQTLGIEVEQQVLAQLPSNINTRRSGRTYHRIEELLIRLKLFDWLNKISVYFGIKKADQRLTWSQLTAMDSQLSEQIQQAAIRYGYEL
jgi:hypothetical protein